MKKYRTTYWVARGDGDVIVEDGRRLHNAFLSKRFTSRARMEKELARIKKKCPDAKGVMGVDLV